MTGIIVTGHGSFAGGVLSVTEMLVGQPADFQVVEFHGEESMEVLTARLQEAVAGLSHCESILIFCDITGGSPFNAAMQIKMAADKELEIIGGVNLPMVIEAVMSRQMGGTAAESADALVNTGREQIKRLVISAAADDEDEYDE